MFGTQHVLVFVLRKTRKDLRKEEQEVIGSDANQVCCAP